MKVFHVFLIILLILSAMLIYCSNNNIVGGPCTYSTYNGEAHITSIDTLVGYASFRTVLVKYNFLPESLEVVNSYHFKNTPDTGLSFCICSNTSNGFDGILAYLDSLNGTFECSRKEILSGTCSPVVFPVRDYLILNETTWNHCDCSKN